jgi:hypothetical protein
MLMRAAALIEGLRLETPVTLEPFVVRPVSLERKFIGRDGRAIFNAELADAAFVTYVDQSTWGAQLWPRRKLALAVCSPVAGDAGGIAVVHAMSGRMTDVLALAHGGDPRVYISAFELSEDDGASWRTAAVMLGEGPYPGSTLDRLADGRGLPALDPAAVWRAAPADPRLALWLSLHRAAVAERVWDARMFRFCALLETIGRETYQEPAPVVDAHGAPILNAEGRPTETTTARGAAYMLLRRGLHALDLDEVVLCTHPDRPLSDEVGVWYDVRNAVAHEGACRLEPTPMRTPALRQRITAAFQLAGRGDLERGAQSYADACAGGTEVVLRAIALGRLALPAP